MDEKYLQRGDAPFEPKVWEYLDNCVMGAAKSRLTGRRLLPVEGPYGLGLKTIAGGDAAVKESAADGVTVMASQVTLVADIQAGFVVPARDIAAFESTGAPFALKEAAKAALACAAQEDALVFYGSTALGCHGLLNTKGVKSAALRPWTKVGTALEDVIAAIGALDEAGFGGPYTLALTPARYNLLFRPYPSGDSEFKRIKDAVSEGIVKSASLRAGGVLLAANPAFASIVLGQDLMTGFVGGAGREYEFVVSESVALRLNQPAAVCVLSEE